MKIELYDLEKNNSVAEFNIKINENDFIISPKIKNEDFYYLVEDLLFIRVKWMTIYLNYIDLSNELENGVIQDIVDMLEHEVKYQNMMGGTYKIIYDLL